MSPSAGYQLTATGARIALDRPVADYLNQGCPLVLHDFCRAWPANGKWSVAWFQEQFGARQVAIDGHRCALSTFLARVEAGTPAAPSPYLREHFLAQFFPELLPDIEPLPGDAHNRLNSRLLHGIQQYRRGAPDLLIAGAGTRFPILHYDLHHLHAFITQVVGDKQFWLYPPDQGRYLYPRDDQANISQITAFDPVDEVRFPDHAHATPLELFLQEGDTIFIPSGWWHRTQTQTVSIAVTWNLVNRSNWAAFVADCYFGGGGPLTARSRLRLLRLGIVEEWLGGLEWWQGTVRAGDAAPRHAPPRRRE